jgi:cobalamin biosynthesis protein CbiD
MHHNLCASNETIAAAATAAAAVAVAAVSIMNKKSISMVRIITV